MTDPDGRRAEHIGALRHALREMRRATRAQLSEATGLSTMTMGKLIAEMERRGEARQDGRRASGGRPSSVVCYEGEYAHFAAIRGRQKEGKSEISMGVYNLFGECVKEETLLLERVEPDSFDSFFEAARAEGFRLRLAVFALPGEEEDDRVSICDFEALLGERFLPGIRERFGVETLFENDVNAAVFGRAAREGAQGVCAGLYLPQTFPPGAGIVVDGKILRGHRHFAGEIALIHGVSTWLSLDYGDEERVACLLFELMLILACTLAPESVVLYGSFSEEVLRMLGERLRARLQGYLDMRIVCEPDLASDMELGAVRLGLRRMDEILRKEDRCGENPNI